MTRQEHIEHLRGLVHKVDINVMQVGSWHSSLCHTHIKECQVLELVTINDECIPMEKHIDSQEVFYQVVGTTTFHDGQVLKEGEIRVIAVGEEHSAMPSEESKVILILQPIDEVYKQTLEN